MAKVIIVGAGLFGSIAAQLAHRAGHKVTVVDAARPWAASKASGCVMAPSWVTSLDSEEIATAGKVLNSLFKVHPLAFKTHLGLTFNAHRVDPRDVIVATDVAGVVTSVDDGEVHVDSKGSNMTLRGKVLVAAGIESMNLIKMPPIRALWGASVLFQKDKLEHPRLHVYAPYRQAVAFQIRPSIVWMGDGTALVTKTWEREHARREQETVERGRRLFGLNGGPVRVQVGARPYVEGHKKGYFAQVSPSTWVATGGAKNGTLLAALYAQKFVEAL
jgi:glycine/D-amino acid oxidase-like deaminating enzyme